MLKNIIILVAVALLIVVSSNLIPVSGQAPADHKKAGQSFKPDPTNSDDYHRTVYERFVIEAIKGLYAAEAKYMIYEGGGNFGGLPQLYASGLIDQAMASGQKYGYSFQVSTIPASVGGPPEFSVKAQPIIYGRNGIRSFFIDTSCVVRGADKGGQVADENDPALDSCSPYLAYQWEYDMSLGMRQLQVAQTLYFAGAGNGSYGSYQDLVDAGLIDYLPSWNWYTWLTIETSPGTKTSAASFKMRARPWYRVTGMRSFFADETGILRGADLEGAAADENTPPLVFENEDLIKFALRSIWKAQRNYRGLEYFGNGYYATEFSQLTKAGLLDFDIGNNEFGGYRFEMIVDNNEEEPWFRSFEIRAVPLVYGKNTVRSFFISDHVILRGADKFGNYADENDPVVEF